MPLRGRQRTRSYNNNGERFNEFLEVGWADFFRKSRLKTGPVRRAAALTMCVSCVRVIPNGSDGLCGTDDSH
jgi:hypothetical protein